MFLLNYVMKMNARYNKNLDICIVLYMTVLYTITDTCSVLVTTGNTNILHALR